MPDNFKAFREAAYEIREVKSGLVGIDLYPTSIPDAAELGAIWSHFERGKGHASQVMNSLFELADEFGIDIYAEPQFLLYDIEGAAGNDSERARLIALNESHLDNEQLLSWYGRLGFQMTGQMRWDQPEIVRRATPTPNPSGHPKY